MCIQWHYINTTNDLPFKNLTDFSSGSCLIYFNIEHNDTVYPVLATNALISEKIFEGNKLSGIIYPLYLNEVIKHDWNVNADDSLFSELQWMIVREDLIAEYNRKDLVTDSTVILNNRIRPHLAGEHQKAVIYSLLKQGINCCKDDETGIILINHD
jgi:hypothetical protein